MFRVISQFSINKTTEEFRNKDFPRASTGKKCIASQVRLDNIIYLERLACHLFRKFHARESRIGPRAWASHNISRYGCKNPRESGKRNRAWPLFYFWCVTRERHGEAFRAIEIEISAHVGPSRRQPRKSELRRRDRRRDVAYREIVYPLISDKMAGALSRNTHRNFKYAPRSTWNRMSLSRLRKALRSVFHQRVSSTRMIRMFSSIRGICN